MKTSLYNLHRELGASFTNFMGYEMPLKYKSINEEHINVRHNVGIFDVSHMGNIFIKGNAKKFSYFITGNAEKIDIGNGQYTLFLDKKGNIIDDEVYFHLKDGYMVIPNSGMHKKIMEWIENNDGIKAEDKTDDYSILAIQGPKSTEVMMELTNFDVSSLKFFDCAEIGNKMKFDINARIIVSRSGYTGEKGFELYIYPAEKAIKIFEYALEKGKKYGIMPIGLGARDSLRLEKGFMLAPNEFKNGRNPFEVGLDWVIDWNHDFIGKDELMKFKNNVKEKLIFLECMDKGIPRHGDKVIKEGNEVGIVSSGGYSPCLKKGIALAFMKKDFISIGNEVEIKGRKSIIARIIKGPFDKKGEC